MVILLEKYDIIVVGAGTGGCMTARTAAGQGYKVCLIDQKERDKIGEKACGEAIGKHHFDNLKISQPQGDELAGKVEGIDVFSPDSKTTFKVKGEGLHGFMINRLAFGQRLVNEALDKGAELYDQTTVLDPIFKNEQVVGVKVKNNVKAEIVEVLGKVVVDACGISSVLRRKMPLNWRIETDTQGKDIEVCYLEIRKLQTNLDDPELLRIYLNQKICPGGYYWVFPKNDNSVNVGAGIQMIKGFPSPKTQLYEHVFSQPLFKDSKIIKASGGMVPTRRPIDCMTGNGILFVGDSACQPNPIHGGGIGPSMIAGKLASEVVCRAIEIDDVSQSGLWTYNVEYMKGYGAKAAALDIFRLFLQKCNDDDLNYGMENKLVKEEDVLHASLGEDLKLNITDKATRVFKGLKKLSFLMALNSTAKMMRDVKSLYRQYPDFDGYSTWAQKIREIFSGAEKMEFGYV
ncbi:MAG: hypothetical protein QG670_2121 [Thermoproteota archaeon]|nr:hypothetical protein [Thermoproteota archaeon]